LSPKGGRKHENADQVFQNIAGKKKGSQKNFKRLRKKIKSRLGEGRSEDGGKKTRGGKVHGNKTGGNWKNQKKKKKAGTGLDEKKTTDSRLGRNSRTKKKIQRQRKRTKRTGPRKKKNAKKRSQELKY